MEQIRRRHGLDEAFGFETRQNILHISFGDAGGFGQPVVAHGCLAVAISGLIFLSPEHVVNGFFGVRQNVLGLPDHPPPGSREHPTDPFRGPN